MRIVIWTDAFAPEIGGLELFCMRLVVALKERGHTCLVVTDRRSMADVGVSDYRGIPVHGYAFGLAFRRPDLALLRREHEACSRLLQEFQPDVIHLNAVMRGAIGFLLQQRQRRTPTVLTLHDNSVLEHGKALASGVLQSVNLIAAISQSNRSLILRCDPAMENKLRVILNALPFPNEEPAPMPPSLKILAIGRLVTTKGFDLAIKAFAALAGRYPDCTLTLAGEGRDAADLRQLAQSTGLGSRIQFTGWIHPENVPALINQHSVVIMPSRWEEPFGLVALEAAQMARPIIASQAGALPEIVVDRVTGTLVPNENLPGYVQAIQSFLENPGLLEKMGKQARLHITSAFSFPKFVSQYEDAYRSVQC